VTGEVGRWAEVAADPGSRVGERLHVLTSGASRVVEVVARNRRMRPTEVHALVTISAAEQAGGQATPGDLAQALRLTTGAITGLVDRLVRSGHVRREPDVADRRRVRLVCRDPGREVAAELLSTLADQADRVVSRLSPEELAVVDRFMAEVADATVGFLRGADSRTPAADSSR
jgi:DNA-binding MarR family transcriptional regulator